MYIPIFFRVRGQRCDKCFKKGTAVRISGEHLLEQCQGCKYAYYCSENCAKNDLADHIDSGECEIIKKQRPPNDNVRFLLRFLLKLRIHDENDLKETKLSIVDKVPWKKELRSFR